MMMYYLVVVTVVYLSIIDKLSGRSIELPQYKIVYSESDFEVRLYPECSWMSALVTLPTNSFQNSTKQGFHRLYQYIHGANLNSTKIPISAPILTTIIINNNVNSSVQGLDYYVRLYLSTKYDKATPKPLQDLNLKLNKWKSHCIAIRKFSGFAEDDNIDKEVESLKNSLNKSHQVLTMVDNKNSSSSGSNSYTIAQYNSSHHHSGITGRLNEVWINVVSGFTAQGCPFYQEE
ncbi:hypothetical protein F8388_014879 [Cannabis sativa]|uniref:SOUL heme-binding protein n=1 Tax=Cannabis sativa TaxID=3483 RepID=A0A7J6HM12_CANSA|nr:hypothetical protein F8388_014879 [Cannabis sativa]KAF4395570.1 hypothetical protein G4B88_011034 [Cannabis sativa]